MERIVDIANPAEGVRASPAFEGGGGFAMRNYLVDPDGEFEPRQGYVSSTRVVRHISSDGVVDPTRSQEGPLVVVESAGTQKIFRLPRGAHWVAEQNKLFFTTPEQSNEGYWIDLSVPFRNEAIYRWTQTETINEERDKPRPSIKIVPAVQDYARAGKPLILSQGLSYPYFVGLTSDAPNADNPISIFMETGANRNRTVRDLVLRIKADIEAGRDTEFWELVIQFGSSNELPVDTRIEALWDGEDSPTGVSFALNLVTGDVTEVGTARRASTGRRGVGYTRRDGGGSGYDTISQLEYENAYFEVEYKIGDAGTEDNEESLKYRYYLQSHRESAIGSQVATSLQAGLSVAQIGGFTPVGLGIGAATAVAGVAGSLIARAGEGERIRLEQPRHEITPAQDTEIGFYGGQILFTYTYSDTPERTLETLPANTGSFYIFVFENTREGPRTKQQVAFFLPKSPRPKWAQYINIYAARTVHEQELDQPPQATGLNFSLIGQLQYAGANNWSDPTGQGRVINHGSYAVFRWQNESVEEPVRYLRSTDHDLPPPSLTNIVSYGSRLWGVDTTDQSIRYSKLGPNGYNFFPNDNAFVPQNIALDKAESPIVALHAAPNDSMLYVFKSDTIHFLRGHGEIRGLNNPQTPVDIDLDASVRKDNIGTSFPRSITTLKDTVLFLGSDRILYTLSGMNVQPVSLSIQPHIDKYEHRLTAENVLAFEYRNCYHLCLPDEVIVLDLQKGYWTLVDWQIEDIFWLQGVQNILYALIDGQLVRLYEGDDDDGEDFTCEWVSNPIRLPFQGVVSGVYVYHDGSANGPLDISIRVNDGRYETRTFTPALYNMFRQGFHAQGHRVQVRVRDKNTSKLRIDRIQVGVE